LTKCYDSDTPIGNGIACWRCRWRVRRVGRRMRPWLWTRL